MKKQKLQLIVNLTSLLLTFFLLLSFHVRSSSSAVGTSGENPFSPKAYLIRYWNNRIYKVPRPDFLFNKASTLSASDSARFAQLAANGSLSTHLDSFCKSASLFCFPDPSPSLEKHATDVGFSVYSEKNFTNYGTDRAGGKDSFANYSSSGENQPVDSFRRYSRDSAGHKDDFTNYANDGNVISQSFNTYGAGATGGGGAFTTYAANVNVPGLKFTSYADEGNGRSQAFTSYSPEANAGDQGFANYGKNGNGLANSFKEYGKDTNLLGSTFTSYARTGNSVNDNFTSYGFNGNVPENKFKSYADSGNAGEESFSSYRDQSIVGDDSFQSYAKNSNAQKVNFANYGQSFHSDNFTGYGQGAKGQKIGFKGYGQDNNFKQYADKGVSFKEYKNSSSEIDASVAEIKGKKVTNRWVEPGKFFREKMLKEGSVMPMPDIKDKMPPRSFLPRSISSKLPFSSSKISQLKEIFHAFDNSSMESILNSALHECERAPSPGETKKCVGSVEDMIDFAVAVLGQSVEPRTTQNVNGSKTNILIGKVRGVNGGKVTRSVSCHQSLYPYLLYYCHSVPKVRVYEADILDPKSKEKINHGVAICHLDTSVWSPTHGAFLALGPGPAPNMGIETLNGANFSSWKDSLMLTLGMLDFDYALREPAPPALTDKSTAEDKIVHERWERCDRMALMLIKNSISIIIRGAIPDSSNAKTYLASVEEQFKATSKAHASTLILKMVTTKYDGNSGIREHIMMMNDMARKLKGLDMEISEGFLVHFIMTSLPASFEAFKVNYNTQKVKWSMNELIAMCVQEEERLKLDKPDVAYLMTTNPKKRKRNVDKKEVPKVQKRDTSASSSYKNSKGKSYCKFCRKEGHRQKDCQDFKEWLTKKGIPYNPEAGKKPKNT